jgi:hypothetical protein
MGSTSLAKYAVREVVRAPGVLRTLQESGRTVATMVATGCAANEPRRTRKRIGVLA